MSRWMGEIRGSASNVCFWDFDDSWKSNFPSSPPFSILKRFMNYPNSDEGGRHDEFTLDWTNRSFISLPSSTPSHNAQEWNINFWFFFSYFFFISYSSKLLKRNFLWHERGSWIFIFASLFFECKRNRSRERAFTRKEKDDEANGAKLMFDSDMRNFRFGRRKRQKLKNVLLHNKENRNAQWIKLAYNSARLRYSFIESDSFAFIFSLPFTKKKRIGSMMKKNLRSDDAMKGKKRKKWMEIPA